MVLYPGKWIWLATPHTASTALRFALEHGPMKESVRGNRNYAPRETQRGYHHFSLEDLPGTSLNEERTGDELIWAVKRNPYDLAVTWFLRYAEKHRVEGEAENPDFHTFLRRFNALPFVVEERIFWHGATEWLSYENLDVEVNQLLERLECPPVTIATDNVTPDKKDWRSYYDDEAFAIMNERFAQDIAPFGYNVETK